MAYASASGSEHALRARRLRIQSKLTPGPSPTPPPSPDPGSEAVLVLEFILHCYYSVLEFLALRRLRAPKTQKGPSCELKRRTDLCVDQSHPPQAVISRQPLLKQNKPAHNMSSTKPKVLFVLSSCDGFDEGGKNHPTGQAESPLWLRHRRRAGQTRQAAEKIAKATS